MAEAKRTKYHVSEPTDDEQSPQPPDSAPAAGVVHSAALSFIRRSEKPSAVVSAWNAVAGLLTLPPSPSPLASNMYDIVS